MSTEHFVLVLLAINQSMLAAGFYFHLKGHR